MSMGDYLDGINGGLEDPTSVGVPLPGWDLRLDNGEGEGTEY